MKKEVEIKKVERRKAITLKRTFVQYCLKAGVYRFREFTSYL